MLRKRVLRCLAAITILGSATLSAKARDAAWTDDLVRMMIAGDADNFTKVVAEKMPASYAKVKEQVLAGAGGFKRLLNGLAPVGADPGVDFVPTRSIICRSYLMHGRNPFTVVFHVYRPQDEWYLITYNLQQHAPENHATYVNQMCRDRPGKDKKQ